MIKRMIVMVLAMTLLVGGIIGYKLFVRRMTAIGMASSRPPPVTVATAEARALEWRPVLRSVGSFAATQGIMVRAQLDGAVTQIAFEPGGGVTTGQLLVQQDVSTEEAQLESAAAAAALAKINLDRALQLHATGSSAQSELDAATATHRQARAIVEAIQSTIDKKTIRAPFAGKVGIRLVNLGQFLRSGADMVSLQALDPIFFNFTLPQQHAANVRQGQHVRIGVDAFPAAVFEGTITALNPDIDETTRTLRVQATLENPGGRLQPGMFGTVELELESSESVVTVPLSAIVYNPYGDAVYIVESAPEDRGLVARQQFVQTGARRGDQVALLKGVKPGAIVVTAGQLKLRSGAAVVVNNAIVPSDAAAPHALGP